MKKFDTESPIRLIPVGGFSDRARQPFFEERLTCLGLTANA
jgi:hypothetical protein